MTWKEKKMKKTELAKEMEEELSNGRGDDEDEQQSACKLYQAVA